MSTIKIVAFLFIVAGIIGLAYGSFTYTKTTHETKVGPVELSIKDKETVNIPIWAGVGAILAGTVLLVARTVGLEVLIQSRLSTERFHVAYKTDAGKARLIVGSGSD